MVATSPDGPRAATLARTGKYVLCSACARSTTVDVPTAVFCAIGAPFVGYSSTSYPKWFCREREKKDERGEFNDRACVGQQGCVLAVSCACASMHASTAKSQGCSAASTSRIRFHAS